MNAFDAIQRQFLALTQSPRSEDSLGRWRANEAALAFASSFDDLTAVLHASGNPQREGALAALCHEASAGDEDARVTLAWAFTPALRRTRRELAAKTTLEADDLDAELLFGFWSEVPKVNGSVAGVAPRLLNRARWSAIEASTRAMERDKREALLPDASEHLESSGEELMDDTPNPIEIVGLAVREGVISPTEAEMVLAERRRVREMCEQSHMTLRAFHSRRWRVLLRIRSWFRTSHLDIASAGQ